MPSDTYCLNLLLHGTDQSGTDICGRKSKIATRTLVVNNVCPSNEAIHTPGNRKRFSC